MRRSAVLAALFIAYSPTVLAQGLSQADAEALKRAMAPDAVVLGNMRLKPYSPEAEQAARALVAQLDDENLTAYSLGHSANNICKLYGFEVTESYQSMETVITGTNFLNFLSENQYAVWQEAQGAWDTIMKNHDGDSPRACAALSGEFPDMIEKVR